jgi:hypothetical protein
MAINSTSLTITDLDFDSILNNFRNYLKSQTVFQDYNFEGSAISELLKLLSYNTFYNAFYINNIANEMYLDSATNRSAVVSRAKSLGYVPTSAISSSIYVDLIANVLKGSGEPEPSSNNFISLNKYSNFSTSVNNIDYTFITPEVTSLYYDSDGGSYWVYKANNAKIVEGKGLQYAFTVQGDYEQYIIPNANVDLNTLIVRVFENATSSSYDTYTKAHLMTDSLDDTSLVYWVYEGIDGKYYIQFGNGIDDNGGFGKKLSINNVVYVEYIMTNGLAANGARSFSIGDYSYSNNLISETSALSAITSDYDIITVSDVSDIFTIDSYVVGANSHNTGYVYSFNSNTAMLQVYSSANSYILGETISEKSIVGANTVIGATATVASVRTTSSVSSGGSNIESIEAIKLNAPKLFASQNRLITSTDYESIIKHEYPYVDAISCWGGEEEVPIALGNVYVAIKPKSREVLEDWEKTYIQQNIIADRKIISLTVNIVDPDYIYIFPDITVKYSSDVTAKTTQNSIETVAKNAVNYYDLFYLNKFNNSFYYTPFCSIIDSSSEFILGNDTSLQLIKDWKPTINVPYTSSNPVTLNYSNSISTDVAFFPTHTSTFTCEVNSVVTTECQFVPSSVNSSVLSIRDSGGNIILEIAGIIDYGLGIITITPILGNSFIIKSTTKTNSSGVPVINIFITPDTNDLVCTKNQILSLYPYTYNITAVPIKTKK